MISFDEFPAVLSEWFPSSADAVRELLRKRPGEGAVSAFWLMSECFWWGIFEPALQARDLVLIERCFQFVELLAEQGDQLLQDALSIRVLDYLFEPSWRELALNYSGPIVRDMFRADSDGVPE